MHKLQYNKSGGNGKYSEIGEYAQYISNRTKEIDNIHNQLSLFDKQLDQYVKTIDNTFVSAQLTPEGEDTINNMAKVQLKLTEVQTIMNKLIMSHSFDSGTLPTPEIIQLTERDGYDKISLIYYGLINNHKKLLEEIQNNGDKQNMEYIYETVNSSVKEIISDIDKFIDALKAINNKIKSISSFNFIIDDFKKEHIALTNDSNIYNYTKRLSIGTNVLSDISPAKMDILTELTGSIFDGLKHKKMIDLDVLKTNESYNFTNIIDDIYGWFQLSKANEIEMKQIIDDENREMENILNSDLAKEYPIMNNAMKKIIEMTPIFKKYITIENLVANYKSLIISIENVKKNILQETKNIIEFSNKFVKNIGIMKKTFKDALGKSQATIIDKVYGINEIKELFGYVNDEKSFGVFLLKFSDVVKNIKIKQIQDLFNKDFFMKTKGAGYNINTINNFFVNEILAKINNIAINNNDQLDKTFEPIELLFNNNVVPKIKTIMLSGDKLTESHDMKQNINNLIKNIFEDFMIRQTKIITNGDPIIDMKYYEEYMELIINLINSNVPEIKQIISTIEESLIHKLFSIFPKQSLIDDIKKYDTEFTNYQNIDDLQVQKELSEYIDNNIKQLYEKTIDSANTKKLFDENFLNSFKQYVDNNTHTYDVTYYSIFENVKYMMSNLKKIIVTDLDNITILKTNVTKFFDETNKKIIDEIQVEVKKENEKQLLISNTMSKIYEHINKKSQDFSELKTLIDPFELKMHNLQKYISNNADKKIIEKSKQYLYVIMNMFYKHEQNLNNFWNIELNLLDEHYRNIIISEEQIISDNFAKQFDDLIRKQIVINENEIKKMINAKKYDDTIYGQKRTFKMGPTMVEPLVGPPKEDKNDKSNEPPKKKVAPVIMKKKPQTGGSTYNTLVENFTKLSQKMSDCNIIMETYIETAVKYKLHKIQLNNFIIYLMLISTSSNFIDNLLIYTHINKGLLQFYLSIIDTILEFIAVNKQRPDVIYFQQNHYIMLLYMQKFIKFVISNIKTLDLVDIGECTGTIKKGFILLNHFKDILESHNEVWQNKVTIYSRINDWNDGSLSANKMFTKNKDNARLLEVNRTFCKGACGTNDYCASLSDGITKIKFTEVFDSDNFQKNSDITKYMTLETQLSKKKGVMLMTYGYSGTGKTFTLFGSSGFNAKQGMLQSTLNNIKGLNEVRFRVLELYGLGVQYPHYWKGKIDQYVVSYELGLDDSSDMTIKSHTKEYDIKNIFEDLNKGFIMIKENNIEKIFKKFDTFIDKLDEIRRKEGRIRITANNPESSRSIVIYEFHLLIEKSYVPFIIIDLPGREEIVETYTDNYLMRNFIPTEKKTSFYEALLSSMSVNPLGLALLVPSIIFNTFNTLPADERAKITDTIIYTPSNITDKSNIESVDDELEGLHNLNAGDILENENLGVIIKAGAPSSITLSYIYNFNTSAWKSGRGKSFEMIDNTHYTQLASDGPDKYQEHIVHIKGAKVDDLGKTPNNSKQIDVKTNSIQYQGVLALHLMNRLILLNKFDIIEKIYENIIKKYLNLDNILKTYNTIDKKKVFLYNYFDTTKIDKSSEEHLNYLMDQVINFRIYLAPFEGIYINENIMGLIKVLSNKILKRDDVFIKSHLMEEQDKSLSFKQKKDEIRDLNFNLYKRDANKTSEKYENIYRDNEKLKMLIKANSASYSSQKIFNYAHPSIESIIDIYTNGRDFNGTKIEPISDFKLFYLFSNTQMKKKCAHQWKLLYNTISFINVIDNTDIN